MPEFEMIDFMNSCLAVMGIFVLAAIYIFLRPVPGILAKWLKWQLPQKKYVDKIVVLRSYDTRPTNYRH